MFIQLRCTQAKRFAVDAPPLAVATAPAPAVGGTDNASHLPFNFDVEYGWDDGGEVPEGAGADRTDDDATSSGSSGASNASPLVFEFPNFVECK